MTTAVRTTATQAASTRKAALATGISRREALLRIGAGGLAVALATQGIETAHAQEATPAAVGHVGDVSGMPEGVNLIPLGGFPVPVHDLPTEPFTIRMMRVTLEPGAVVPLGAVPEPPPRAARFRCLRYSVVGTSSMPRTEAWSVPSLRRPSTVLGEV